jgi:16S rRNA (guanine(1405)-N(7))-methyltransferase
MNAKTRPELIGVLKRSRKYANLCEDTLTRIADWAAARHKAPKSAIKAAKRKLHQVYGAYFDRLDLARVEELVQTLPSAATEDAVRATCREILACHASTAERLPLIDRLYPELLAATGAPSVILDLACGLHPFALPWMALPPQARYHACDIDHRLIDAVSLFLKRTGRRATAECRDILVSLPDGEADVAFLLKTVPCLEQQEPGATVRLLRRLRARHVVVSFPAKTLGGREKGMRDHYDRVMSRIAEELRAPTRRLDYPNETFYVVRRCREQPPWDR